MSLATATQPRAAKIAEPSPHKTGGTFPRCQLGQGLTARLMEISPSLAQSWLAKNPRVQRNLSQAEVDMLVRHRDADEWVLNGATIVFGNDDRLYDGQHRLAACVKSGKPITSIVIWGVDPASFDTMDAGRSRNGRDALKAAGVANQTIVSSACQLLYRHENNLPVHSGRQRIKLSPMEIIKFTQSHKGLEQTASHAQPVGRIIHNGGVALACRWLFDRISKEQAAEFYERLAIGDKLDKGHPILVLRNKLMPAREDTTSVAWMMILAWNAVRSGVPLKIKIETGQPLPKLV